MARNMHKYEDLTPYEFDREKERASIIYVAAGPLEYHEECNCLGLDTNKGYDWCLAAAEITGGIVFPMLPIAPAGSKPHMSREDLRKAYGLPHYREEYAESFGSLYPGMFFSRETCRAVYTDLLEMLALELQFKLCVFVGSHGPAGRMLKDIIMEVSDEELRGPTSGIGAVTGSFHGMRVMTVGSRDYNNDFLKEFNDRNGIPRMFHGGLWEAALNYAIEPEYFQPELLDETKYPQHFGALREDYSENPERPCKAEFRKFTPEYAYKAREITINNMVEDVLRNYAEIMAAEQK